MPLLVSFHGGPSTGLNNLHLIQHTCKDGFETNQPILPAEPPVYQLRGFVFHKDDLYCCGSHKKLNTIVRYSQGESPLDMKPVGDGIHASHDTTNSLFHPYQIVFDEQGNAYVSNQNTNTVTKLDPTGSATEIAPYLVKNFPDAKFLDGTWVASSVGHLPHIKKPRPPNVPAPQGLEAHYDQKSGVQNSVRGLAIYRNKSLLVSDEPGCSVKVYDLATGELTAEIKGELVDQPVQLLIHNEVLYIGCKGNNSVLKVNLSKHELTGTIPAEVFIDGHVKNVSGMTFDDQGTFYVASRTGRKIFSFDAHGKNKTKVAKLDDDPEFILWVPHSDPYQEKESAAYDHAKTSPCNRVCTVL